MKKERHLLLWERMGDYHRARWRALSAWTGRSQCIAADLGTDDGLYQWEQTSDDPNHEVLVQKPVEQVKMWEAFKAFRHLVVSKEITHVSIPGYGRPAYILMLIWSRLTGRKVLMFAESWYRGRKIIDLLKGGMLRLLTHRCFVSGEHARSHFVDYLRYPEARVQTGYSVIDNNHFGGKEPVDDMRDQEKYPRELLCVARFAKEKNLGMLIEAFKQSALSKEWKLVLVGGGPLEEELRNLASDSAVELRPWVSYDDLPKLYQEASCFILPSQFEPWGLVVNEAMAAGLPVLLSNDVGAKPDLLEEGANGWGFESNNKRNLIGILDRLAETTTEQLLEMGERSKDTIRHYSLEGWASSIAHGRYCWKKMEVVGKQITIPERQIG